MHLKKIPCCTLLVDNNDKSRMVKLNDTALIIWQLCTDDRSVEQITTLLSEAFEQDPEDMGPRRQPGPRTPARRRRGAGSRVRLRAMKVAGRYGH